MALPCELERIGGATLSRITHADHSWYLPFLAEAGCLSQRLLPDLPGAASVDCRADLRRRPHILDSDSARWFLEALEMQSMWSRSPREHEDSPIVEMGRSGVPDCRFSHLLDVTSRIRFCVHLVFSSRRTNRCNPASAPSAAHAQRAVSEAETCHDPARRRCRLPILPNAPDGRHQCSMVVSHLWRCEVLAARSQTRMTLFTSVSPALHCLFEHCFESRHPGMD